MCRYFGLLLLGFSILAIISIPVSAITIAELTLEELIDDSDHVVIASLNKSSIVSTDPFMEKEHILLIKEAYKGSLAPGTLITVLQDVGYGSPSYPEGQLFLLFIVELNEGLHYYILNSIQGMWPIDDQGSLTWWGSEHTLEEVKESVPLADRARSGDAGADVEPEIPEPEDTEPTIIKLSIGSKQYHVNGLLRTMDTAPMIREGRTLLPIRFIAEPLGAALGWDTAQQKAIVAMGTKEVELWIGQNRARVNGVYQYIDSYNHNVVPIIFPPGRTMLPLRFIAETLGCQVDWNEITREVTVVCPAPN